MSQAKHKRTHTLQHRYFSQCSCAKWCERAYLLSKGRWRRWITRERKMYYTKWNSNLNAVKLDKNWSVLVSLSVCETVRSLHLKSVFFLSLPSHRLQHFRFPHCRNRRPKTESTVLSTFESSVHEIRTIYPNVSQIQTLHAQIERTAVKYLHAAVVTIVVVVSIAV